MDLKEEFKQEWRLHFQSASVPDLRCFTSVHGMIQDVFSQLDSDEKEFKQRLDQANFTYNWIVKKKKGLREALEEETAPNRQYANLKPSNLKRTRQLAPETLDEGSSFTSNNSFRSHENSYLTMKTNLAKKLSLDDCHSLACYFSAIKREAREKITSTASFIDLLQSVEVISELHVDGLMGALEAEQLKGALAIVKEYKNSISRNEPEQEERYLKMSPARFDQVVSVEDLETLSRKIVKSFKMFGTDVLKLSAKEIEKWQGNSDSEHQQALRMLLKWKQRVGVLATTAQLLDLLKQFNYGPDVWGFLEGTEASQDESIDETADVEIIETTVVKGYVKSSPDQLSVKRGDKIKIQDRGRPGWYYGEVMNQQGWVPNYCIREEDRSEGQFHFLFVIKAITDSGQREEGFLTYRLGEHLDVVEETFVKSKTIYRARNKDGFIGFVKPANFDRIFRKESILCGREWFHPRIGRLQADMLLRLCPKGAYLIRESRKPGDFVLNVKTAEDNTNFLIKTTNVGYKILDKKFKSISEIIEHYRRFPVKDDVCLVGAVRK